MKSSFILILLVVLVILVLSIFYLSLIQKEKKIDNQIESERNLNHNLKVFLQSKLSIFNLSKLFQNNELRKMDENDLIILEKKEK